MPQWARTGQSPNEPNIESIDKTIPPPFIGRYDGGFREPADLPKTARGR